MWTRASSDRPVANRFGWLDALAFVRAFPRIALRRRLRLGLSTFARISAIDVRHLPRQRFFTASDGADIAYRNYAGPDALHLVLIHGSACFGDQFHVLARRMSEGGIATVHTLDMRGHGQSPGHPRDFARYAEDVTEYVRALAAENPLRRIVIGGHSAGGGLVSAIARGPGAEGIAGWMLFAPFMNIADPGVKPWFGGWVARIERLKLAAVVVANALGIRRYNSKPLLAFDREACLHDPRFAREWPFTAIFGFGPGPAQARRMAQGSAPLLLLAGDRDDCFEAAHYRRALARIAPAGECRILAGLGHWDILVDGQALDAAMGWIERHFPAMETDIESGEFRHVQFG